MGARVQCGRVGRCLCVCVYLCVICVCVFDRWVVLLCGSFSYLLVWPGFGGALTGEACLFGEVRRQIVFVVNVCRFVVTVLSYLSLLRRATQTRMATRTFTFRHLSLVLRL